MYVSDVSTSHLERLLIKELVRWLTGERCGSEQVSEFGAALIVNQLLYLEASDPEKEISMYINSRGAHPDPVTFKDRRTHS
jgi:ATP-dependent protease ClpP protease subunit